MIIYNVTINVNNDVAEAGLSWMIETHIPEVMNTGMFVENNIYRLIGDEQSGGITYAIQYKASSMEMYERYKEEFAPALQQETLNNFGGKFTAFRSLLEVIK